MKVKVKTQDHTAKVSQSVRLPSPGVTGKPFSFYLKPQANDSVSQIFKEWVDLVRTAARETEPVLPVTVGVQINPNCVQNLRTIYDSHTHYTNIGAPLSGDLSLNTCGVITIC